MSSYKFSGRFDSFYTVNCEHTRDSLNCRSWKYSQWKVKASQIIPSVAAGRRLVSVPPPPYLLSLFKNGSVSLPHPSDFLDDKTFHLQTQMDKVDIAGILNDKNDYGSVHITNNKQNAEFSDPKASFRPPLGNPTSGHFRVRAQIGNTSCLCMLEVSRSVPSPWLKTGHGSAHFTSKQYSYMWQGRNKDNMNKPVRNGTLSAMANELMDIMNCIATQGNMIKTLHTFVLLASFSLTNHTMHWQASSSSSQFQFFNFLVR